MNEENIRTNEEVNEVEVMDDYEDVNSGLGWKIIGGVLAAAGAIWGGLKLKKMIKARKEKDDEIIEVTEDCSEIEEVENVEIEEEKKNKKKK